MVEEAYNPVDEHGVPLRGPAADHVNTALREAGEAARAHLMTTGEVSGKMIRDRLDAARTAAIAEYNEANPDAKIVKPLIARPRQFQHHESPHHVNNHMRRGAGGGVHPQAYHHPVTPEVSAAMKHAMTVRHQLSEAWWAAKDAADAKK